MAIRNRTTNQPTTQPAGNIMGVGYPVTAAQLAKGAKPKSAPSAIVLAIANTTQNDVLVPIFNLFHQNDEANTLITAGYNAYKTAKGGSAYEADSLAEVVKNYNPEAPVSGVQVKAVNGKPLVGIYEELKSMTTLIDGVILTSDNSSQFNEQMRIEYSDWDGSKDSVIRDFSEFKDVYANDSSEISTDIAFYLDGRCALFLPVKANSKLTVKFKTKYHYNRMVWQG